MRNERIDLGSSVPLSEAVSEVSGAASDPFALARRLQTAVWIYDIDNARIAYANQSAVHLWDAKSEDDLRKRDLAKDMSSTVANRLKQYQADFQERDAVFNEMWTLYPKGKPTSAMVVYRGFEMPDGRMAMQCEVLGEANDQPDNLRSAEALLHTDVMITLYEMDGPPLYMNPAARNAAKEVMQKISDKFVDHTDYDKLVAKMSTSGEHRMVAKVKADNGQRWYDLSAKQCSDAVTGDPAILVTAIDVSELKIARDKARYLADRDQLTGCYNRAYLLRHMAALEKFKTERCALLYFDVDHFKQINDRLGHELGDVVLQRIATRTNDAIRSNDTLVRLGGDEFVIVFEDVPSEAEFLPKIENLLEVLSRPITHDTMRVSVTASMGIAMFSPVSADFTAVMREADTALYASKQAGRNRVTVFNDEMGSKAQARDLVELQLKNSVKERDFVLHFQPRVNLATGRVVSVEGLVRWQHPDRGIVLPGEFIPICEETGLIEELGQLVLEMGCKQAIAWHRSGIDVELSLNISPRQFDDARLMEALREFSKHPDFPDGKIELEITESVLIGDHGLIEGKLEKIAQMGYRIAIDDFGTGYSNLSYISRFPLNCLKIDQSFINQLPKTGPIIGLILTLAKQIGATVVAEGVETQEQFDWLCQNECNQVQGFLLSRPVPVEEIEKVIEKLDLSRRGECT
ncbi:MULTISPECIES: bifunctional diguanylate cyclase/phosphodiesterase [unclassified Roseovarius]|uniref:putative bifunctional diguanylate cyclase/phosphodiesterase n=1 Tax=unclassified Roseovarius TaxID=2614913 RepID=UPI00273FEE91|nr:MULTISPECIES: EAL domain-containing protein [unclassified Roseovarius]